MMKIELTKSEVKAVVTRLQASSWAEDVAVFDEILGTKWSAKACKSADKVMSAYKNLATMVADE